MTHTVQQITQGERWQIPFFAIWTGQTFSLAGSRVAQFALIWWLTQQTGSATILATATLVGLLPEIVLGPIAGAYVDRWNRRRVMILADALVALASMGLACLFWLGAIEIWHIYAVMVVRAIGGSFHWPAMQASTSLMVPKKHLSRVAGFNQALNGALSIVGPPLGALLLALLPLEGIMLVDVGTAGLAILPLFFVMVPQPPQAESAGDGKKPTLWADIRGGLGYIASWPGLVVLIALAMVIKVALTPAFSLLPLLVSQYFGGDAAQLSLLESLAGVGIIAGGLILSVWGGFRRRIYTVLVGIVGVGLGFIILSLTPTHLFIVALGSILVVGLAIPLVDGPIMAIMQGTVAPEMQGRVFTLMGSLLWLTSPLGLGIAGPVSDLFGLQVWYLVAGLLCVVLGSAGFFVPALIEIEENHRAAAPEGTLQAQEMASTVAD
jgi:DHA3 family macrolide efflux protein-like MFS transporter